MSSRPSHPDLDEALKALDADQLRQLLHKHVAMLDEEPRRVLRQAIVEHALRVGADYSPKSPGARAVAAAEHFAAAAREVGYADPVDIDGHLAEGAAAFLARDYQAARSIFEALLLPIANAEIDLGQHELVEEVLGLSVDDCAARYVAAVYLTSTPAQRPEGVFTAVDAIDSLTTMGEPIAAMERVALEPLPALADFLPLWTALLQREGRANDGWANGPARQVREAVLRTEGIDGLARLARRSRAAADLHAWCSAIAARGDLAASLDANEEAAGLVREDHWRGDFLDSAALASRELARSDFPKRLEAAWLAAPTLTRLLRWLMAGDLTAATVKSRAKAALAVASPDHARLRGLLLVLVHDVDKAADLLARCPGLGWSSDDHPGHVVFPVLSWLIGGAPPGSLRETVAAPLHRAVDSHLDVGADIDAVEQEQRAPRLATPSIASVLDAAGIGAGTVAATKAILMALRRAAEARTDGVLREKRRRHYEHAALLVGCCVELARANDDAAAVNHWAEEIRQRHSRFSAFQNALRATLAAVKA